MPRKRGKKWTASGYSRELGRKIHLGTFSSHREAREREAEHHLASKPRTRETIGSFAGRWVQDYPRPRPSTNTSNAERIKPLTVELGALRMADVTRPIARAWALKHRWALPAARAMFADAMNDGLVDHNPFAGLGVQGSAGRKRIVALTEPELRALADRALVAWPDDAWAFSYRAMVLFAGYVGLRPGELFALPRANVAGDLCLIDRALESKSGEIGLTKNGRDRTVTVPPFARDAIADLPPTSSGLLFESRRGQMWRQSSHHHCWSMVRTLAGMPGRDFYELRHAAATMLLERGMTPSDVAVQLGHTDGGRLVQTLYGHPSEVAARQRLLAAWDEPQTTPGDLRSGTRREQAS
ncbi:MAG: tyrosine-type recombinase/integrase [Solirubrobacteraceae bacterium]